MTYSQGMRDTALTVSTIALTLPTCHTTYTP